KKNCTDFQLLSDYSDVFLAQSVRFIRLSGYYYNNLEISPPFFKGGPGGISAATPFFCNIKSPLPPLKKGGTNFQSGVLPTTALCKYMTLPIS
ncbi:hypothetical protein QUF80_17490, partial [Desulfococcaceae bacterium HSG8]|nr:hypothetical protein [Desulfococcaceae bacterium HSG8]